MNIRIATTPLLAISAAVSLCFPAETMAMDPLFELSPQQVLNAKAKEQQPPKPATAAPTESRKTRVVSKAKHKRNRHVASRYKKSLQTATELAQNIPAIPSKPSPASLVGLLPAWEHLVSSSSAEVPAGLLSFQSEAFSLTIDPAKYPMLPAQDGSTLLLDPKGQLPPLVRTLIQEKGRTLKVVGSPQQDTRKFLGELLESGGFYSVVEKPMLEFGSDPRLTVRADFKVEKSADSLTNNQIVLVNAANSSSSPGLTNFLKKEGVSVVEPFVQSGLPVAAQRHSLFSISPKSQPELVDTILGAISVHYDRNRRVELFSVSENGFGLSVQTDWFFVRNGQRYVITRFTGDAVAYTLLRLLETKGYKVVILEGKDDFKAVSEKIFAKMELSASYAPQLLISDPDGRYSLELSGLLLENITDRGGKLVLTDRKLDQNMRAVLSDYGYRIEER